MNVSFQTTDLGLFNKAMLSLMDGRPRKFHWNEGDRRIVHEGTVTEVSALTAGKWWRIVLRPADGTTVERSPAGRPKPTLRTGATKSEKRRVLSTTPA